MTKVPGNWRVDSRSSFLARLGGQQRLLSSIGLLPVQAADEPSAPVNVSLFARLIAPWNAGDDLPVVAGLRFAVHPPVVGIRAGMGSYLMWDLLTLSKPYEADDVAEWGNPTVWEARLIITPTL
jgi:hypothetical protein